MLWMLAICGIGISLAFVSDEAELIRVEKLEILIDDSNDNFFLNESDVRDFFRDRKDPLIDCLYKNIDVPGLEKGLETHPAVDNAEVCATLSGAVKINITQRRPVIRIINKSGESYYIDSHSELMPLSENYSARVLVATGEIDEPFSRRSLVSVDQISGNKTYSELSMLDELYAVACHIQADSSLKALIHQIQVNKDREIELYPAAGNHRIILGDASDLTVKFNKLRLFYTEGLNPTNGWKKYSAINLKYKNLVVCTKK